MESTDLKQRDFNYIILTRNERKYILCLYRTVKGDQFTLIATDGGCLYRTRIKSEGWKKIWNDFASASIHITDDAFVAKLPGGVEYRLEALKGSEKSEEMFSLIVMLAESNQGKRVGRETEQQIGVSTLSNFLADSKSTKTALKGSSIASPSKKKRKVATGVIYE